MYKIFIKVNKKRPLRAVSRLVFFHPHDFGDNIEKARLALRSRNYLFLIYTFFKTGLEK